MKQNLIIFVFLFLILPNPSFPWGRKGHAIINANAVSLMPAPVNSFFLFYKDSLALLVGEPDEWKKRNPKLRNRHFIDLDMLDVFPFRNIPVSYKEALSRFGRKKLRRAGILPWAIEIHYKSLVKTFRRRKWKYVRNDLIALAHYIGDGHQPLHLTANYDGRKTNNPGIHSRYETELLERFPEKYINLPKKHLVKPTRIIKFLNRRSFNFMIQSYTQIEPINKADIRCKHNRPNYNSAYFACFEKEIGSKLRTQLARAASQVSAFWFSAWIEAGKPEMIIE